ncbi:MAG: hypothetical protein JO322_07040 [Candidatus Eremiobacteraeota bacterium]|nr:hypothetical protein [Candidatus Eremiobacteraeota bacterium]
MSDLGFSVIDARAKQNAASPTIAFRLHIASERPVDAIVLRAELRIEPQWRTYDREAQVLLGELFGTPDRWQTTLRTFAWADVTLVVPGFARETDAEITVPCTYDFDVAATRFFDTVHSGEIPVRFLFSGAVYRDRGSSFSTERVAWNSECSYRMPVSVWHDAMRACYGSDALIRIKRETLEELRRYRALSGATTWDELLVRLLGAPT